MWLLYHAISYFAAIINTKTRAACLPVLDEHRIAAPPPPTPPQKIINDNHLPVPASANLAKVLSSLAWNQSVPNQPSRSAHSTQCQIAICKKMLDFRGDEQNPREVIIVRNVCRRGGCARSVPVPNFVIQCRFLDALYQK